MDPRQMEKLGISCRTAGNIDCGHSRDFSDHSLITAGGNLFSKKKIYDFPSIFVDWYDIYIAVTRDSSH